MQNEIAIITIGSAFNKDIYKTISSVIDRGDIPSIWIFTVFNKDEKVYLDDFLRTKIKIQLFYKIFTDSQGIASALNKSIKALYKYDCFVWILHAGDLCSRRFLNEINAKPFANFNFFPISIEKFSSKRKLITATNQKWIKIIKNKPCIMHQGLVAHINTFKEFGLFDEKLKSIMDYEWFFRISNSKKEISCFYYDNPIASFKLGGKSSDILTSSIEHYKVFRKYNYSNLAAFFKSLKLFVLKALYTLYHFR